MTKIPMEDNLDVEIKEERLEELEMVEAIADMELVQIRIRKGLIGRRKSIIKLFEEKWPRANLSWLYLMR